MYSRVDSRYDGRRQASVFVGALLWAVVLLALAPGARGEPPTPPEVDDDPTGAPYVAGELLVAYEPGTPDKAEKTVVRESGGQTVSDLPGEMRLVSFPSIEDETSQETRESTLERELQDLKKAPQIEAADYNYIREVSFTPDDPGFDRQWGLTKASFPGAWDTVRGNGARIAVVDSGAYSGHIDIGRIVAQHDFVKRDAVADDDNGHGTHVTGVAGALTNNGKGVAGGCPGCGLLIAKVVGASGSTTDARIVKGINWSVKNGADVVNLSLGGPGNSSVLRTAVSDASKSAVVVGAAGNEGTTVPQYPAAYPEAIAVSATNASDQRAKFSSRGDWVDLAAPGVNILSTVAGGGYSEESGTSESAPLVSALAGLLASQGTYATPLEIRTCMESTATDLGPAGDDPYYGHGRIDAASAVQ